MEQLYRFIFLFFVLTISFQCSSVRKATEATKQMRQSSALADSLRDTKTADVTVPDTTITPADVSHVAELTPSDTDSVAAKTDSLSITAQDSLSIASQDSLTTSTQDSLSMEDQTLKAAVYYTAQDSMIFTNDNMGYLYGDADIQNMVKWVSRENTLPWIWKQRHLLHFGVDSVGKEFGLPLFSEGGQSTR